MIFAWACHSPRSLSFSPRLMMFRGLRAIRFLQPAQCFTCGEISGVILYLFVYTTACSFAISYLRSVIILGNFICMAMANARAGSTMSDNFCSRWISYHYHVAANRDDKWLFSWLVGSKLNERKNTIYTIYLTIPKRGQTKELQCKHFNRKKLKCFW